METQPAAPPARGRRPSGPYGQHRRAGHGVRHVVFFHDALERDAEVLLGHERHADEEPERRERVDGEAAGAAEGRVAVVEDHLIHCESIHGAISVVPRAPRYA